MVSTTGGGCWGGGGGGGQGGDSNGGKGKGRRKGETTDSHPYILTVCYLGQLLWPSGSQKQTTVPSAMNKYIISFQNAKLGTEVTQQVRER